MASEPNAGVARAASATAARQVEAERSSPGFLLLCVALYVAIAALAALIELLLVPLRIGTVLVPVCIVFGAATNIALPILVRQVSGGPVTAASPIAAWFITLALLAGSRPEGDVLIPGGTAYRSLAYVFYGLVVVGVVAGVVTVVRSQGPRPDAVSAAPAGRPQPVPTSRGPVPTDRVPARVPGRARKRR